MTVDDFDEIFTDVSKINFVPQLKQRLQQIIEFNSRKSVGSIVRFIESYQSYLLVFVAK